MTSRVLYTVRDSPPGRAVQMALEYLDLNYEVKEVDFDNGEHFSADYIQMYPQGELPVLNDFGHVVGESVAIIQYLAGKYPKDESFYPKDPERNSIVHHRLAFYLSTYYRRIHDYYVKPNIILPMDYAYERTPDNKKKLDYAVKIFNEVLRRQNTEYVAGDKITVADLPLVMGTVVCKAMGYDFENAPYILKWFENFQKKQTTLWKIAQEGLDGLAFYDKNPRDMSHLKHPIHPTGSEQKLDSTSGTSSTGSGDDAKKDL